MERHFAHWGGKNVFHWADQPNGQSLINSLDPKFHTLARAKCLKLGRDLMWVVLRTDPTKFYWCNFVYLCLCGCVSVWLCICVCVVVYLYLCICGSKVLKNWSGSDAIVVRLPTNLSKLRFCRHRQISFRLSIHVRCWDQQPSTSPAFIRFLMFFCYFFIHFQSFIGWPRVHSGSGPSSREIQSKYGICFAASARALLIQWIVWHQLKHC